MRGIVIKGKDPFAQEKLHSVAKACDMYYTWGSTPIINTNEKPPFYPMTHHVGEAPVLSKSGYLLGYNEPDLAGFSPESCALEWDKWAIEAKKQHGGAIQLVSPAPAENPIYAGSWLERFIDSAEVLPNILAVHRYIPPTYKKSPNARAYREMDWLQSIAEKYGLPVMLTELGINTSQYGGTPEETARFLQAFDDYISDDNSFTYVWKSNARLDDEGIGNIWEADSATLTKLGKVFSNLSI